ncbi:carboxylesterase/lipase family protein [Skermania sp. ID1734]|uniref:carboxylesterase/lipase family protein n=1 Tax=Skermania sp. ID1734 TaxID=2597516 RepID=UPI00117D8406|nr:carboxylesterase/lipase family protein [Skermania sp. ID1734]TSD99673.1 carboxylesterase/lipase family protein [Skermania sp. ID1734]
MSDALEVTTDTGVVRGRRDANILSWRGIPYAAPPVGELRFRAPHPVAPWDGVRDARRFGAPAPQRGENRSSEDCLTLNVCRPAAPSEHPRPVMVFIHGGAYVSGSSARPLYRGDHLARTGDIVFVSINYRLGALGYLDFSQYSTPDTVFETNVGLRDQIAALQWVQRNIAAFGGDPDNVTIFGESSGGNAVTTLMCTPATRGLFARGIAQSPPAASVYSPERAKTWAQRFLELLASEAGSPQEALLSATPEQLVRATDQLTRWCADDQPGTRATAPVVDGDVLPQHPLDAFAAGTAHSVPLIIGTNSHEGRFFPLFMDIIPTNKSRIEEMFAETDPAVKARVLNVYPGYPGRLAAADLGGDVVFWEPSILCAQGHSQFAPTYCYRYDFSPRLLDLTRIGATHGTELLAVFGFGTDGLGRALTLLGGHSGMRKVTELMQSHWISFARNGVPGPEWPRYDAEKRETLIIDEQPRVIADPRRQKREAWIGYRHRR